MEINEIIDILNERGDVEMAADLDGDTGEIACRVADMITLLDSVLE